jgi:hypothetical protein
MNTNRPASSPGIANTITVLITTVREAYRSVMTIENSPLKNFDPIVAHLMFQVLAFVWSAIFALMLGSFLAFGISAVFHVLFISGVCITALVFKEGNRRSVPYRLAGYNGRNIGGEHE